jgi:hypothetical protein
MHHYYRQAIQFKALIVSVKTIFLNNSRTKKGDRRILIKPRLSVRQNWETDYQDPPDFLFETDQ